MIRWTRVDGRVVRVTAMFTCNELRETLQTDDIARNCTRNRKQRPAATAKPYSPGGAWHIVVPPGEYD